MARLKVDLRYESLKPVRCLVRLLRWHSTPEEALLIPIRLWSETLKGFKSGVWPHIFDVESQLKWSGMPGILEDALKVAGFIFPHRLGVGITDWPNSKDFGLVAVFETIRKRMTKTVRDRIIACGRCAMCGSTEELTVDHKMPISKGGKEDDSNLQCLCALCNTKKGAKWRG